MKVYIATKDYAYGGTQILGVFAQMKDAIDMAKACENGSDETGVEDFEVIE